MTPVEKTITTMMILFFIFGALGGVGAYDHYWTCPRTGESLQLESKHEWLVGCFVKTPSGKWVNVNNY